MPSVNVLRNVNLAIERRGGVGCPNPSLNPTASCGAPELTYTVLSLDEENQKWYPTNQFGFYTPDTGSVYGDITGSATVININQNGCNYPAVYFSGSATFPLSSVGVFLGIVTGSFRISGSSTPPGGNWYITSEYETTGSITLQVGTTGGAEAFEYNGETTKNSLVGFELGTFVSPFNRRDVTLQISGSSIATNPPYTSFNFEYTLGSTFELRGEGIIRSFGTGPGTVSQQTQFNCLYGSTPSK